MYSKGTIFRVFSEVLRNIAVRSRGRRGQTEQKTPAQIGREGIRRSDQVKGERGGRGQGGGMTMAINSIGSSGRGEAKGERYCSILA